MQIGELANAIGVSVQTLHFYERKGLLPPPERKLNGYRTYCAEHLKRLVFIRHCRALDITLDEIARLLQLLDRPADDCFEARVLVVQHLEQVRVQIASLQALERHLEQLQARCEGHDDAAHCGILAELAHAARGEACGCAVASRQLAKTGQDLSVMPPHAPSAQAMHSAQGATGVACEVQSPLMLATDRRRNSGRGSRRKNKG